MAILPFNTTVGANQNNIYFGDAVPTTGTFNAGDILFITTTSAATPGYIYPLIYRCVTASSANNGGTWVAVGTPLGVGSNIASASSISPVARITHITGTTAINTVVPPTGLANGESLVFIPNGAFTFGTGGNVAYDTTAVVGKAVVLTWDAGTATWYPSY